MISPESRLHQLYALPVQCLPIKSLKDNSVRGMADKIIQAMVDRNMNVSGKITIMLTVILDKGLNSCNAGFTTDGEFNSCAGRGVLYPWNSLQKSWTGS